MFKLGCEKVCRRDTYSVSFPVGVKVSLDLNTSHRSNCFWISLTRDFLFSRATLCSWPIESPSSFSRSFMKNSVIPRICLSIGFFSWTKPWFEGSKFYKGRVNDRSSNILRNKQLVKTLKNIPYNNWVFRSKWLYWKTLIIF